MSIEFEKNSRPKFRLLAIITLVAMSTGCYQRKVAPELTFDQTQVEVLDEEIEKMEWE